MTDERPTDSSEIIALKAELAQMRGVAAIRGCVTRYMQLCDQLDAGTRLDDLLELFTPDAVWEGRGARYANSFGAHHGRHEIGEMFRRYMTTPPHFAINAHFLCSEHIDVADGADTATAGWMMLQTSTFASGQSHLNAARLTLRMVCDDGQWRIARFQTENLFSRPVTHWDHAADLPVPKPQPEEGSSR